MTDLPKPLSVAGIRVRGLVLLALALILIFAFGFFMLRSVGRIKELDGKPRCAANLRGITQSMNVYGADGDCYPIVAFAPYATVPNAPSGKSATTRAAALSSHPGDVQACMWILASSGLVTAKQFICPEDRFASVSAVAVTDKAGNPYDGFQNSKQLSYSLAYPWNADGKPGAWWKSDTDEKLPLIADMAPMQGTGTPARNLTPAIAPADNRTWNSGNHGGDGQNVGFADGHAEFVRSPNVGHNNDNIYTMSAAPSTGPAEFGGIPAGKTAPQLTADKPPFDILMLPVRNESTGGM